MASSDEERSSEGTTCVGPWIDEMLPVRSQLQLRQVAIQAGEMNARELRECLMATWRGWLMEREVVRGAMLEVQVDLQVEFPEGFLPREILDAGAEG